ncbi:hypothetical protein R3W88_016337 [Solanum pinnatisectum]|uniref:Uncharacterized protein n=1 Tax=Solanum pinnatisectum TaxID=50273 RepID=A0AAV9KXA5_9SOLN|nr:hypothetical protein R3W88_016337 [Solanum pinnatisectum]
MDQDYGPWSNLLVAPATSEILHFGLSSILGVIHSVPINTRSRRFRLEVYFGLFFVRVNRVVVIEYTYTTYTFICRRKILISL